MRNVLLIVLSIFLCCIQTAAQRTIVNFDEGWRFHFGNASDPSKDFGCGTEYFNYLTKAASVHNEGPYCDKFVEENWKPVTLPHDFVVDLPFAEDASHSHGYKQVGYKYPETSVGWYRKSFTVDKADKGKHVELLFDGIFRDSRVWVNGFYCGGERSGYLSQCYDITDYLNYGGENIVCVRCDATLEEGWFYEGAGIYRHAWLTVTNPLHIENDGVFIRSVFRDVANNAGGNAKTTDYSNPYVIVTTTVRNASRMTQKAEVRVRILDANGKEIANGITSKTFKEGIKPSCTEGYSYMIPLANPHLWSPDTPYLYNMVTEVVSEGKTVDVKETKFGVRHIVFDKDNGLLVNGKQVKIKGVNLHQDNAGVGTGIPDALQVWRIRQLKDLGCNAYRSSHNPMSPAMLDVCDSLGILVIDENRLSGSSEYALGSLKKMIMRDRNHPSIILWSVGNEEWGIEWNEKGERIAATMRDYCHQFDPSRQMTFATSGGPTVEVPVDVAGYNYVMQNPIEEHRANYPERKCYGSEETTGCGTRGVYFDDPQGRWMKAINRAPNGKDSIMNCIERGWKFYAERPWAAGCFFWTGFDYRGEPNPLKYPAVDSEFGILDYAGFPKDEAWYLKAWWTDETVLHILPHWNLQGHEGKAISVWAYSNCDEVELIVNGKSQGRKTMPQYGHLEWDVVYNPGRLVAIGYKNGKKVKTETVETTQEATVVSLSADRTTLQADGRDVAVITVALKDKKGRVVPTACNNLNIHIEGDMRILGVGNGDPAGKAKERPDNAADRDFRMKAFNGYARIFLQTGKEQGKTTLTVTSEGLRKAVIPLATVRN